MHCFHEFKSPSSNLDDQPAGYMLQILSSNRFGHDSGHMQLMFAGSMLLGPSGWKDMIGGGFKVFFICIPTWGDDMEMMQFD